MKRRGTSEIYSTRRLYNLQLYDILLFLAFDLDSLDSLSPYHKLIFPII